MPLGYDKTILKLCLQKKKKNSSKSKSGTFMLLFEVDSMQCEIYRFKLYAYRSLLIV